METGSGFEDAIPFWWYLMMLVGHDRIARSKQVQKCILSFNATATLLSDLQSHFNFYSKLAAYIRWIYHLIWRRYFDGGENPFFEGIVSCLTRGKSENGGNPPNKDSKPHSCSDLLRNGMPILCWRVHAGHNQW
jgi:hypothetical protein